MKQRRTAGCHGNLVISHVKLQINAEISHDIKELMTTNLFFLFVRLIPDISKKAEATKGYHEIKSLNFQIM